MNSPLNWVGGKRLLAKTIVPLIPEHTGYCEVFAGAAWVFFRKPQEISQFEVLNDLDGELINFYQVVKHNWREFVLSFKYDLISRQVFNILKASKIPTDPVLRARWFYYLLRCGYGGKMDHHCFPITTSNRCRLNFYGLPSLIKLSHKRLLKVTIENLDFEEFISRYDRQDVFFYVDPPYYFSENKYACKGFERKDHNRLADIFKSMKGKFILSINDLPETRQIYGAGMNIMEIETLYTVSKTRIKKSNQMLITNYDCSLTN